MARPPLRCHQPPSGLCLMDWTAILESAGIPEPPGRPQAVAATLHRVAIRRAAALKPKASPGSKTLNAHTRSSDS